MLLSWPNCMRLIQIRILSSPLPPSPHPPLAVASVAFCVVLSLSVPEGPSTQVKMSSAPNYHTYTIRCMCTWTLWAWILCNFLWFWLVLEVGGQTPKSSWKLSKWGPHRLCRSQSGCELWSKLRKGDSIRAVQDSYYRALSVRSFHHGSCELNDPNPQKGLDSIPVHTWAPKS